MEREATKEGGGAKCWRDLPYSPALTDKVAHQAEITKIRQMLVIAENKALKAEISKLKNPGAATATPQQRRPIFSHNTRITPYAQNNSVYGPSEDPINEAI